MWCTVGGSEVWVDGGVLNDPVHTCKVFKVIKCAEGSSMQEKKMINSGTVGVGFVCYNLLFLLPPLS